MNRAAHLNRLRTMLNQVMPESVLESAGAGLENVELPDFERSLALEGLGRLQNFHELRDDSLDLGQQNALEAIVMPKLRPVVNIIGDTFIAPPSPWEHLGTDDFKRRIEKVIPSIGRVEIIGHPSVPFGGTGFVVGPNLLMTNRHVAEIFATGKGQKRLAFIPGRKAAMDFKREAVETQPELLTVTRVVMIHPFWDAALLEVSGLPANHPMLPISVTPPSELAEREIVVIGYPARDWRNDGSLQSQIFGNIFNVKRLQPGILRRTRAIESFGNNVNAITHDASTLGGNSGSAMIDVRTGHVVGLHFAGLYLDANFGVPMYELARDSRVVDAGVNFQGRVAPTNDWSAIWRLADQETELPTTTKAPTMQTPSAGTQSSAVAIQPVVSTWTVPLQISITIGAPQLVQGAVSVAAPVVTATVPGTSAASTVEKEAAANEFVTQAYSQFDKASFSETVFSWKSALSTIVCSHLVYEEPDVVLATVRDRFGMLSCEFVRTDATECFVAATPDSIIVSFRGTAGLRDWLGNLNAFSTTASYGVLHRGFYFGFQAVKASLERIIRSNGLSNRKLVLTGHSLGGALATVAAAEWQGVFDVRSIYTFGQPRVGKADFAGYIQANYGSKFFRFVNDDDIVTRVPPGYQHVGQLFHFGPQGDVGTESTASNLTTSEPTPLTDSEFAALQATLRETPASAATESVATESVGLEGFLPSVSDHYLANYMRKILMQLNSL